MSFTTFLSIFFGALAFHECYLVMADATYLVKTPTPVMPIQEPNAQLGLGMGSWKAVRNIVVSSGEEEPAESLLGSRGKSKAEVFFKRGDFNRVDGGDDYETWNNVTVLLHSPKRDDLTLAIGDRLLNLRMVSTNGIVAPGAQLLRDPDGPAEPLLSKNSCHFTLYDGSVNVGSLFTCHPLGHHVMLMLDDSLVDVIPNSIRSSEHITSRPKEKDLPVEDYESSEPLNYQPMTFPQYVAKNFIDTTKFRNIFSNAIGDMHLNGFGKVKKDPISKITNTKRKDGMRRNKRSLEVSKEDESSHEKNSILEFKDPDLEGTRSEILDPDSKKSIQTADLGFRNESTFENEVIRAFPRKTKRGRYFQLTVEIALFLDAVLLNNLYSFYTEDQVIDLILSLMNNVQAFFHQKSLGRRVDLSITQLYLLRTQPVDLPTHGGHRMKLLKSFCGYQQKRVHKGYSIATNWDLAVYLSGMDLVAENEAGDISDVTMGLTFTGGICDSSRSCIISEFGTTNAYGKPFPSAGALASLILAHEIGHSLGLRHDGTNNTCKSLKYMMAPGRGPRGGSTWSTCSKKDIWKQTGECLRNSAGATLWDKTAGERLAGQVFDAVAQCQLFFRDHDATLTWPTNLRDLCHSTQCSSPHRLTAYLAGPAFEGTYCGAANWCRDGSCVPWTPRDNVTVIPGGLGLWEEGPCTSACLDQGTGWKESRRPCNNPSPRNSDQGCVTTTYKTEFCDDRQVCGDGPRRAIQSAINELCHKVSERYHDALPRGHQMAHREDMPWQSCVLYCHIKSSTNGSQVWTPRYLYQDDPTVPTHLPPGAPCHTDPATGTIYRCFHRTCIPHKKEEFPIPQHRDFAGIYEYRDAPSLDDLVIDAGPPPNQHDYPQFDLDDLF